MATVTDTYTYPSSGFPTIKKDPQATLDYPFDWAEWLTPIGDSIASVTFTVDPSLTKVSQSFTSYVATAVISGGVAGTTVPVACKIVTNGGRTDERTINLKIVNR